MVDVDVHSRYGNATANIERDDISDMLDHTYDGKARTAFKLLTLAMRFTDIHSAHRLPARPGS